MYKGKNYEGVKMGMLIRNGFTRDLKGEWINLNFLSSIEVLELSGHTFLVIGNSVDEKKYKLSNSYSSRKEAQEALDDMFD